MNSQLKQLKESEYWENLTKENSNIDELLAFITSRKFEANEKSFLKNIINTLKTDFEIPEEYLSLRVFISCLIISKYPDALLSKDRKEIEENLYEKAKEIFNFINEDLDDFKLLGKKLVTFKIMFDNWKQKDLESQMDILCETYYRYKETLDQTPNNIVNNSNKEIVNFIAKIEKSMKRLSPDYKTYLENYRFKKVSYDEKAYNLIYKKLKKTYWDYIQNKIFNEEQYTIIDRIIDDYKELIDDIEINDVDLSSILSYKGVYSINALLGVTHKMIEFNNSIDSEHYDEIYIHITNKLISSVKYIPDILKFLFERLEFIKNVKKTVVDNK